MNAVNKTILILLSIIFVSCEKDFSGDDNNIGYTVQVNVPDGVEFFVHSTYMGEAKLFKIGTKAFNASASTLVQIPKGKTAYIKAQKTTSADTNIEMIVTKAVNGEVIYQGTGKNAISIDVTAK